ncbi:FHA domain-containing protein [Candidatus Woesearchaeota archaeon]|nr:FHA domain-containing protein [Candidatus Woesearchaeota archaeon]
MTEKLEIILAPRGKLAKYARNLDFTEEVQTAGRDSSCDQTLIAYKGVEQDSANWSRVHFRMWESGGSYFIVDAGSRHGTYVNDKRADSPTEVKLGDKVYTTTRSFASFPSDAFNDLFYEAVAKGD